ncbi:CRISPR-associated helicase/endonuclease Cas3 [soil metagenome]
MLPGISVRDHCLNVGCVADALIKPLPESTCALLPSGLSTLAALHDVGKISPGFQRKCPAWLIEQTLHLAAQTLEWTKAESDHSKVSQFTIQHILREQLGLSSSDAALWAAGIGMHHGAPHWRGEWKAAERSGILPNDVWEAQRRELADELAAILGAPGPLPHLELRDLSMLWQTAGLITVADWIGSDETFFSPARADVPAEVEATRAAATAALQRIGMEPPQIRSGLSFSQLFDFPPNDLQSGALEVIRQPGVYVIEAPMGLGKTEAALAVAYQLICAGNASGLYFALPTQATSNRIHERVGAFLARVGPRAPRLVHGGSWLLDKHLEFPSFRAAQPNDQRREARDWFASTKRALLAPFGVGTVDQALLGVIAVRHFFVRHFALAGKVVVLDEVHSYDVFTGTLIEALVRALRKLRCTIIILSATLTGERREKLLGCSGPELFKASEPVALINGVAAEGRIQPRPIELETSSSPVRIRFRPETSLLPNALEAARKGACVLWICNTVDRAQATYRTLCGERREGDPALGLLHSRFPFFRRQELEEKWMRSLGKDRQLRPNGCLLIGTQVVEQSVDLDADLLISELAPTDMLFQRLGRLWRHPQEKPRPLGQPELWIIEEVATIKDLQAEPNKKTLRDLLGKKARVYAPYVLLRTLEQWHDKEAVHLPTNIRPWLEATYRPRSEEDRPAWKEWLLDLDEKQRAHAGRAEAVQNCLEPPGVTR